jgi:predicted HTH domain antitoxin
MSIAIPDSIMLQARVSESELLREIAIMLFRQERITLGSAAQLAAMPQPEFQMLLGSRGIAAHYTDADLEHDVETLHALELI